MKKLNVLSCSNYSQFVTVLFTSISLQVLQKRQKLCFLVRISVSQCTDFVRLSTGRLKKLETNSDDIFGGVGLSLATADQILVLVCFTVLMQELLLESLPLRHGTLQDPLHWRRIAVSEPFQLLLCLRPHIAEALSDAFV